MGLGTIREKLNRLPKGVVAAAACALIASAVALCIALSSSGDYPQPDIVLKCTACGYRVELSVDEFNDRRDKELPGTTAMFQGIALKCDKCGKKALLQEQGGETILSSPPTNKR